MSEYRLVSQRIPPRYDVGVKGPYDSAHQWVVLQTRATPTDPWQTLPAARFEDLPKAEQTEIIKVTNAKVACKVCNGNDLDTPCAYPGERRPGCLRG